VVQKAQKDFLFERVSVPTNNVKCGPKKYSIIWKQSSLFPRGNIKELYFEIRKKIVFQKTPKEISLWV